MNKIYTRLEEKREAIAGTHFDKREKLVLNKYAIKREKTT